MENLRRSIENLNTETLRKQITEEILYDMLRFANKQQLKKVVNSPYSTQQMKQICIKILAERETVTKSDNENDKASTSQGKMKLRIYKTL